MSKLTKAQIAERDEARETLRNILKPGDTVYTTLRHVSSSGMTRVIGLHIVKDGDIRQITYLAAKAMNDKTDDKRDGIRVGGCGMDMGFHLVYNLGRCLYPEGFAVEGRGRNGDTSGHDKDGGYALRHCWI